MNPRHITTRDYCHGRLIWPTRCCNLLTWSESPTRTEGATVIFNWRMVWKYWLLVILKAKKLRLVCAWRLVSRELGSPNFPLGFIFCCIFNVSFTLCIFPTPLHVQVAWRIQMNYLAWRISANICCSLEPRRWLSSRHVCITVAHVCT